MEGGGRNKTGKLLEVGRERGKERADAGVVGNEGEAEEIPARP